MSARKATPPPLPLKTPPSYMSVDLSCLDEEELNELAALIGGLRLHRGFTVADRIRDELFLRAARASGVLPPAGSHRRPKPCGEWS